MARNETRIIRAALAHKASIYRDIEIEPGKSPYRLADAIVAAFDFDFDHAFGFYDVAASAGWIDASIRYELFADMGEAEPGAPGVKKTKIAQAFAENGASHPRWPARSSGGIGGEFAPVDATQLDAATGERSTTGASSAKPSAPVTPAQITIPAPFDFPIPPLPSEILPPPVIPDIAPRSNLRNPYPDRPECEEQWA